MNALRHSFATLHNFLNHIALNNCVEYFEAQKANPADRTRRDEHRHLFNAVVALDSLVDHLYHAKTRTETFERYREDLLAKEPVLRKVRELANALKHCVTHDKPNKRKPNAADLAELTLHVKVDFSGELPSITSVDVSAEFLLDAPKTVEEAWNYWIEYAHQLDREGVT